MKNFVRALSTRALSLHPPAMHPAGGSAKREQLRRATKEGGAAGPESRAANKQRAWQRRARPATAARSMRFVQVCAGSGKKRN